MGIIGNKCLRSAVYFFVVGRNYISIERGLLFHFSIVRAFGDALGKRFKQQLFCDKVEARQTIDLKANWSASRRKWKRIRIDILKIPMTLEEAENILLKLE